MKNLEVKIYNSIIKIDLVLIVLLLLISGLYIFWTWNHELADLLQEYFKKYKAPYPYFLISVFGELLPEEHAQILGEVRLISRTAYNKTHDLTTAFFSEIAKPTSPPKFAT